MCSRTLSVSASPRGLCGWPLRRPLLVGLRLHICEYFYFSFRISIFTLPSKCLGQTPDGQDFDTFVGAEKAKEIKGLFSSWIDTIFRTLCVLTCRLLALVLICTLFSRRRPGTLHH